MASSSVIPFQPRNCRLSRVANIAPAALYVLSEHRSLLSRYQDSCRQADVLNASVGELWLRAYLTSIQIALVIAGLHRSRTLEHEAVKCPSTRIPEKFSE